MTSQQTASEKADLAANEKELRGIFQTMDAAKGQEIRESFYKAIEGLRGLVDNLEMAAAERPETDQLLTSEYLLALKALDAMNKSGLGRVL